MSFGIIAASVGGSVIGSIEPEGLLINILTPTEAQEIEGDVITSWEILNVSSINILTPTEGQEIEGDVTTIFELI